jgi:hypothetical protein
MEDFKGLKIRGHSACNSQWQCIFFARTNWDLQITSIASLVLIFRNTIEDMIRLGCVILYRQYRKISSKYYYDFAVNQLYLFLLSLLWLGGGEGGLFSPPFRKIPLWSLFGSKLSTDTYFPK